MFNVKWASFKKYSGPRIVGKIPLSLSFNHDHLERALYLTSMVESGGKFGTVVMFDGTGITAGLTQAIAVYPKELEFEDGNNLNDQGPLWKLLSRIEKEAGNSVEELWKKFKEVGWYLDINGVLRNLNTGKIINGRLIRETFTPNQGVVPRLGKDWTNSKEWALVFNRLFSNPQTFETQINFGKDHIIHTSKQKFKIFEGKTIEELVYSGNINKSFEPNELDLAMCTFWSHVVNAPAIAFRKLKESLSVMNQLKLSSKEFAHILIMSLRTSSFGRWNADIPGGRYQRERKIAIDMKTWNQNFFEQTSIMPPKNK